MLTVAEHKNSEFEITADAVREQLTVLVEDPGFRSSKRSVQFLRYVVEQTLAGRADQIKERTIGIEVFGRDPSYDTNLDHIVRTAAIELRKRLAVYYGDEQHRSELRLSLVPGSYIPRFFLPTPHTPSALESEQAETGLSTPVVPAGPQPVSANAKSPASWRQWGVTPSVLAGFAACALIVIAATWYELRPRSSQDLFWKPIVETPGFVLLAVGDVPDGPPTAASTLGVSSAVLPIAHKAGSFSVPFADAVTIARVTGTLQSRGKRVVIRREGASTFSELRESPVVLIGAFNNEWSLRLTQNLRYSLALDADRHLIYIRDARNPSTRAWSWATNQPTDHHGAADTPSLQDFALISRIWNSETGHAVIIIGGLYTYGTETAGEFLTDPRSMEALRKETGLYDPHRNLQIVLGTTVTDGTAGPPRVLAVSTE